MCGHCCTACDLAICGHCVPMVTSLCAVNGYCLRPCCVWSLQFGSGYLAMCDRCISPVTLPCAVTVLLVVPLVTFLCAVTGFCCDIAACGHYCSAHDLVMRGHCIPLVTLLCVVTGVLFMNLLCALTACDLAIYVHCVQLVTLLCAVTWFCCYPAVPFYVRPIRLGRDLAVT